MRFLRMLWKCFAVWVVKPAIQEELRGARAVLAFADSRMRDGSPGSGNELIAGVVRHLHTAYDLPILVQEEVALAAPDLPYAYVVRGEQTGTSSRGWNTAVIANQMVAVCRRNDWKRVAIATTPAHLCRAMWVAERLGLQVMAAAMPKGQYFHKDLALWACRGGELRFRSRELLVRLFFLLRGDI